MRLPLTALLVLTACAPEQPRAGNTPEETLQVLPGDEPAPSPDSGPPPPPPPPPPAPSAFPGLQPVSEKQGLALLGAGARCALSDGGEPLMVAVPGAALVNDGGRVIRLEATAKNWAALLEGGRFAGRGIAVQVDAGAVVGGEGQTVVRDASTGIWRGRRGIGTSHGPRWTCRP